MGGMVYPIQFNSANQVYRLVIYILCFQILKCEKVFETEIISESGKCHSVNTMHHFSMLNVVEKDTIKHCHTSWFEY